MNMMHYGKNARFDTAQRALTEDELRAVVPSVFAMTAHESRSARFAPIPTIEIVRALMQEGFGVVGARQAVARQPGRRDFTKHFLRIRKLDGIKQVGDTVFEALLKNGNDGTSVYDILAGLWRVRCQNSMVAMTMQMESLKVRHSGNVKDKVIEGTYRVINDAERALEAPDKWSQLTLDNDEQMAFATSAHQLRFADAEGNVTTNVKPQQLLIARRTGDQQNDLWTTFNVVQENAIKGGLNNYGQNANGQYRRGHTRPIKAIDTDVRLNRALFTLAAEMAKLKAA